MAVWADDVGAWFPVERLRFPFLQRAETLLKPYEGFPLSGENETRLLVRSIHTRRTPRKDSPDSRRNTFDSPLWAVSTLIKRSDQ